MSINLFIPEFVVPPSQLAANMYADMHNTLRPNKPNAVAEPASVNPATLPNAKPNPATNPCLDVPASDLLRRLASTPPADALPIEPATWTIDDVQNPGDSQGSDRPYLPHRVPGRHTQLNPFNPAKTSADLESRLIDLFV